MVDIRKPARPAPSHIPGTAQTMPRRCPGKMLAVLNYVLSTFIPAHSFEAAWNPQGHWPTAALRTVLAVQVDDDRFRPPRTCRACRSERQAM